MPNMPHKRKQYVVKKGFQLRYVGRIVGIAVFSAVVSGYTIYYNAWIQLGEKLAYVYPQGQLVDIFRRVNLSLAVSMFFVVIFCIGVGLIFSHRIAGPIDRMKKFLEAAGKGDYSQRIILRKKDELQDLAEAMNKLVEKLESEKKS